MTCIAPFLPELDYPSTGGDVAARFCTTLDIDEQAVSCCLPCPTTYWLFSDNFPGKVALASYISIVSLVLNVFLLLTFLVLPQEKSHRHYLSIGLTSCFILIAIAFVIPLGTKPDLCYNDITPNNEKTQASCAATGVLVELGAMGAAVWILLRSVWTTLRITVHLKRVELFKNISIGLGIGLPLLFLAISLPITSVSYTLGNVCVPSHPNAMFTWFIWLLIFTAISWVTQLGTIFYCGWLFRSSALTGRPETSTDASTSSSADETTINDDASPTTSATTKHLTPRKQKHVAWKRARGIIKLQWRSIIMCFVIVNLVVYFGAFFVQESGKTRLQYLGNPHLATDSPIFRWMACLMANGGDKEKCLRGIPDVAMSEARVEVTLILASCIGIFVFLLMVRGSMFVGWWHLIRNPRVLFRRPSVDNDDLLAVGGTRAESPPDSIHETDVQGEEMELSERKPTSDTSGDIA